MDLELIRIRARTLLSTSLAVVGLSLAIVGGFNLLSTAVGVDPVLDFYRQIFDVGYTVVDRQRGIVLIRNSDVLVISLGSVVAYLVY